MWSARYSNKSPLAFWNTPILLFRFQNMKQKTLYLSSSFFVWGRGMSLWIRMFPSKTAPSSMAMRGV